MDVELCSVKQLFEEDELSMSETERKRFSPSRGKKRKLSKSAEPSMARVAKLDSEPKDNEDEDELSSPKSSKLKKILKTQRQDKPEKTPSIISKGSKKRKINLKNTARAPRCGKIEPTKANEVIILSD